MKNLSIKLACIFIIVMYCLAPLSALDLNQSDNNTKYSNQDDNTSKIEVKNESIPLMILKERLWMITAVM